MIKLIVSDMDGTLLNHHGTISKTNLEAIAYAKQKGVDFVIATGRDYSNLKNILEQYNISCASILGNGAQYCNSKGEIISSAYFPKILFKDVMRVFDELHIQYMIFATDGFYTTNDPIVVRDAFIDRCCHMFGKNREEYFNDGPNSKMPCMYLKQIQDIDCFLSSKTEIIKFEAFNNDVSLIEKAKDRLKDINGIAYLSSFNDNVEVTDISAQKGLILEKVIKSMNLKKDEVMVIGDGLNDITMFERFPYSFAPSNANEIIKSLAYKVVVACKEDAVSDAIYYML